MTPTLPTHRPGEITADDIAEPATEPKGAGEEDAIDEGERD